MVGRTIGRTPELSLDVPDGTPLVTATVPSPPDSVVSDREDMVPDVGVVMALTPRAVCAIPTLGC